MTNALFANAKVYSGKRNVNSSDYFGRFGKNLITNWITERAALCVQPFLLYFEIIIVLLLFYKF